MLTEVDWVPAQKPLLARLWAHEPSSKEELTEALWAEAPTVAKMPTRMGAAGLVER